MAIQTMLITFSHPRVHISQDIGTLLRSKKPLLSAVIAANNHRRKARYPLTLLPLLLIYMYILLVVLSWVPGGIGRLLRGKGGR